MSTNSTKPPLYEGKAKKIFEGPEPGTFIQYFKDDATAFNNEKKGIINGKGVINNCISGFIMNRLLEVGIPNHFIKNLGMREQLVHSVEIIPIEVIVRNYTSGSFCKRFGVKEGEALGMPLIEFCLKDDDLGDPFISEEHIYAFDIADPLEIEEIRANAMRINDYLSGMFSAIGIRLIDMKLEFGRLFEGEFMSVILADEISPDTCRLWDMETSKKLDKDRFRQNLGDVDEAYREVAKRLGVKIPTAEVKDFNIEAAAISKVAMRAVKPRKPRKPVLVKTKEQPKDES